MDPVQTSYALRQQVGAEGLPYDLTDLEVYSAPCKFSDVRYGVGLMWNVTDDDDTVQIPDSANALGHGATNNAFVGISLREHVRAQRQAELSPPLADAGETSYIPIGHSIPIATRGRVWVRTEQDVTPDMGVYCRHVAAGAELLGAFRGDADTADAVLIQGARFMTKALAGELVVVSLSAFRPAIV